MVGSFPKPYGGVATHCYYLSQELTKEGNEVLFLDTEAHTDKDVPFGVRHFLLHPISLRYIFSNCFFQKKHRQYLYQLTKILGLHRLKNIHYALSVISILHKIHLEHNFTHIHSHHVGIRSLAAFIFAKKNNLFFVLTAHGAEITIGENWEREKRLISFLLQNNTQVITVSEFTSHFIKKRGFKGKINIIPNGIDPQLFRSKLEILAQLREKYKIRTDQKTILFLSSFKNWKGPDVFLNGFALLPDNYRAIMIGNDLGYLKECKTISKTLGIHDRVTMLTNLPFFEIVGFYNLADVFVFPTCYPSEGFGIVALEAMAAGTPVVASRIAAIPEVVKDGITGLLFEPGNPYELAQKVELILSDRTLAHLIVANATNDIRLLYCWNKIAKQVNNIYQGAK